jgi:hypothetical protein
MTPDVNSRMTPDVNSQETSSRILPGNNFIDVMKNLISKPGLSIEQQVAGMTEDESLDYLTLKFMEVLKKFREPSEQN